MTAELIEAIHASPDDPFARRVYGDWLASRGDWLGEWIALAAESEAAPTDRYLRGALVTLLGDRAADLLGERGAELLATSYLGWSTGFLDELRVQRGERTANSDHAARIGELLAQPAARFVRTIGIGDFTAATAGIVREIAGAAPRSLTTLVAHDAALDGSTKLVPIYDPILEACGSTLARLGLRCVALSLPAPHVREVVLSHARPLEWLADATVPCPALTELTLEGFAVDPTLLERALANAPALRTLRVVGVANFDAIFSTILRHVGHLALLDMAHVPFTVDHAARLPDHVALATARTPHGRALVQTDEDPDGDSWIARRLAEPGGRDALALVPGAGLVLYQLGTNRAIAGDFTHALAFLAPALTLPQTRVGTMSWANAAIAHEKLGQLAEAALLAREALLRAPREPNFFAILIDALRRDDHLADALAELPRARAALDARGNSKHNVDASGACLVDCLLALAQAGRHTDVLQWADDYHALFGGDGEAILAMSFAALGEHDNARASVALADTLDAKLPVIFHARAVVALLDDNRTAALDHLRALRRAAYTEWHWLATDPNLAALRGHHAFEALLAPVTLG